MQKYVGTRHSVECYLSHTIMIISTAMHLIYVYRCIVKKVTIVYIITDPSTMLEIHAFSHMHCFFNLRQHMVIYENTVVRLVVP